jgi:hypothetical protein
MSRMDEDAARNVLLVRAIETADSAHQHLTEDDRRYASRTAAEMARWQANASGTAPSADYFLGKRAELLITRLGERQPIARAARALAWRPWIGVVLPLVAFLLGAGVEHIADRRHINILAFPLMAIVVWNLLVYALLLTRLGLHAVGRTPDAAGLRRWIATVGQRSLRAGSGPLSGAFGAFGAEWAKAVARLAALRAGRVLHLAAALFAIGAVAGLYVRGLVFEYRAGWESTFLEAPAVHAILSFFLTPAANFLGIPFPSVAEIAALRFPAATAGENAARWIHLYAVTVSAVVIAPRLALALLAAWRERRLSNRIAIDLDTPYFRRLLGPFARGTVRLRVVPYSYTVDEASIAGLRAVAGRLLGDDAELLLSPSVAYGAERNARDGLALADPQVPLTIALFSLAATPEGENHGAFIDALRAALAEGSKSQFAVIVDEAGYRRRLGEQAAERLAERRQAWQSFCAARGLAVTCVDLSAPDLARVERELDAAQAAHST